MNQTRNVFTTEFKHESVRLIVDQGYGVVQAAKAMNVGLSTLQRWLRQYRQELQGCYPTCPCDYPGAVASSSAGSRESATQMG